MAFRLFDCCAGTSPTTVTEVLLAAALSPSLLAHSQTCKANAPSTIATDRPQITRSSVVVPCGSLQLENGLQVTSSAGQRSVDFPETSVRIGIAKTTEFQFIVPNYFNSANTAAGFFNGLADPSLGFKQHLGPIAGFDLSVVPSLSLPTGSNSISSHGYDPAMQLSWSHSVPQIGQVLVSSGWDGRRNQLDEI